MVAFAADSRFGRTVRPALVFAASLGLCGALWPAAGWAQATASPPIASPQQTVRVTKAPLAGEDAVPGKQAIARYRIGGGFFPGGAEALTLVHRLGGDWVEELAFYRNRRQIGRIADQAVSVVGLCRAPDSGRLAVLLSKYNGAAAIPPELHAAEYDAATGRAALGAVLEALPEAEAVPARDGLSGRERTLQALGAIRCAAGQKAWPDESSESWEAAVVPCACAHRQLVRHHAFAARLPKHIGDDGDKLAVEDFGGAFFGGKRHRFAAAPVDGGWLDRFLGKASALPAVAGFHVTGRQSARFAAVTVGYRDRYQYLLVGRKTGNCHRKTWVALHSALYSSKSDNVSEIVRFVSPTRMEIKMCVSDCGWWGRYGLVEIDLETRTGRFVRYLDDNDAPVETYGARIDEQLSE